MFDRNYYYKDSIYHKIIDFVNNLSFKDSSGNALKLVGSGSIDFTSYLSLPHEISTIDALEPIKSMLELAESGSQEEQKKFTLWLMNYYSETLNLPQSSKKQKNPTFALQPLQRNSKINKIKEEKVKEKFYAIINSFLANTMPLSIQNAIVLGAACWFGVGDLSYENAEIFYQYAEKEAAKDDKLVFLELLKGMYANEVGTAYSEVRIEQIKVKIHDIYKIKIAELESYKVFFQQNPDPAHYEKKLPDLLNLFNTHQGHPTILYHFTLICHRYQNKNFSKSAAENLRERFNAIAQNEPAYFLSLVSEAKDSYQDILPLLDSESKIHLETCVKAYFFGLFANLHMPFDIIMHLNQFLQIPPHIVKEAYDDNKEINKCRMDIIKSQWKKTGISPLVQIKYTDHRMFKEVPPCIAAQWELTKKAKMNKISTKAALTQIKKIEENKDITPRKLSK